MTNAAFGARGNRKSASHREYQLKLNLRLTTPVAGCCNSVIYCRLLGEMGCCSTTVQYSLMISLYLMRFLGAVPAAVPRAVPRAVLFFFFQFSSGVCNVQNSTVLYLCTQCWLRQLNVITVFISLIFLHNIYYLL